MSATSKPTTSKTTKPKERTKGRTNEGSTVPAIPTSPPSATALTGANGSTPPSTMSSPIHSSSSTSLDANSSQQAENEVKEAQDVVVEVNQVTFRIDVEATIITDEAMKKEKKFSSIQVNYEFYKEQYKSEASQGSSFSSSSSHKVNVDEEMLQYLLSSALQVQVVWRNASTAGPVTRSPSGKKKPPPSSSSSSSGPSKTAPAPPPPSSAVEFCVTLDMSSLLAVNAEKFVSQKLTIADGVLPSGITELSVRLLAESPILNTAQSKKLNPMTITIMTAKNLPSHPFKSFSQMHTECLPVYSKYQFFHEQQVTTPSFPQNKNIKWLHKKTFFTGSYKQAEFVEYLENTSFRVEIHDRDRRTGDKKYDLLSSNEPSGDDGIPTSNDMESELIANVLAPPSLELTDVPRLTKTLDSYGVAIFSLLDLCRGESALKLQSEILPNAHPSVGLLTADSPQEYLPFKHGSVHTPGLYVPNESTMSIKVEITHPLAAANIKQPFCRAFYIFLNGEHTETLKRVLFTVQDVNSKALKIDVATEMTSATLHSRLQQLNIAPEEGDELDIITGFLVSDRECVILCLEGLADKGMKLLESRIQRPTPASNTYKLLCNMDLRFHSRLYAKGGLGLSCIKSICLSDPLHVISQQKQIYFRKLSNECYQAIHHLQHITQLSKLYEVKAMHLFLDYPMLTALERYFGIPIEEPITSTKTNNTQEVTFDLKPNAIEHKQKTVDIPYIKLNSWALLQKMKQ